MCGYVCVLCSVFLCFCGCSGGGGVWGGGGGGGGGGGEGVVYHCILGIELVVAFIDLGLQVLLSGHMQMYNVLY